MRSITGAILILAAEQAFAHAYLIGFPNQILAQEILIPASVVLSSLGALLLVWGVFADPRAARATALGPAPEARSADTAPAPPETGR